MADRPARIFGVTSSLSGLGEGIIANSISFANTVDTAEARDEKRNAIGSCSLFSI